MGKLVVATPIASDVTNLVGFPGNEFPTMPITNLLTPQPQEIFRAKYPFMVLRVDFPVPTPVQLIWLGYTNAEAATTWRITASDSYIDLISSPSYDSGTILHWPSPDLTDFGWERNHAFLWLPAALTFQYWGIYVTNITSYEVGRLYVAGPPASLWQSPRGVDFGWQTRTVDPSTRARSLGGNLYPKERGNWRELSLGVSFVSEADLDTGAERIDRLRGGARDVLVIADPEDPTLLMRRSVYGVMRGLEPSKSQKLDYWRKRYVVEEWEHP